MGIIREKVIFFDKENSHRKGFSQNMPLYE